VQSRLRLRARADHGTIVGADPLISQSISIEPSPAAMPRRVFKPLMRQRHRWKARWFMRPFATWLENPAYWSLNRRNVTRAFSLGLFLAFVPLPIHALLATALALLFRLNIPAAVVGTFLTNPLTVVPMFVFAYWVGCALLMLPVEPIHFAMNWHWFTSELIPIWRPFLLGCLTMGIAAAITGYVVLGGLWHVTLLLKYHQRKPGPPKSDQTNRPS
jgi:uncharacterized protein (DUF2062 family)